METERGGDLWCAVRRYRSGEALVLGDAGLGLPRPIAVGDLVAEAGPEPGLLHHTDRGGQYLSAEYRTSSISTGSSAA